MEISPEIPLIRQKRALNQLQNTREHCQQWLNSFLPLLHVTRNAAPVRRVGARNDAYGLRRHANEQIDSSERERLLEQAIWVQWSQTGGEGQGREFIPDICRYLQAYQVPLQESRDDLGWGKVDLIGVSSRGLPVVIELKREQHQDNGNQADTPLWMLAEAISYALAVQKSWAGTDLRNEWANFVLDCSPDELPLTLDCVPILCAAPESYWSTRIGTRDHRTRGRVPPPAWPDFHRVVAKCRETGFPGPLHHLRRRGNWSISSGNTQPTKAMLA